MSSYILSLIRTYVPILVTLVVGWLLSLGITVDDSTQLALVGGLSGLIGALYYAAVRWLEQRYPSVGALIGAIHQPVYVDPKKTAKEQLPKVDADIATVSKTPLN